MNLKLSNFELFNGATCEGWKNEKEKVFMTAEQIAVAFSEDSPASVKFIINGNVYLRQREFSTLVNFRDLTGKNENNRLFNIDGITEIAFLSSTRKAREFRRWVRSQLKETL